MIDLQKLTKLFSEYGTASCRINGEVLHIKFYDPDKNYREIFIGEKNWKNDEYTWTEKETGIIHYCTWTESVYKNTWSRIIQPGYENLAKIIK